MFKKAKNSKKEFLSFHQSQQHQQQDHWQHLRGSRIALQMLGKTKMFRSVCRQSSPVAHDTMKLFERHALKSTIVRARSSEGVRARRTSKLPHSEKWKSSRNNGFTFQMLMFCSQSKQHKTQIFLWIIYVLGAVHEQGRETSNFQPTQAIIHQWSPASPNTIIF